MEDDMLEKVAKIKEYVLQARGMKIICENKQLQVKETANLPPSEQIVTVIGDYAHNLDLIHTGDEKSGECYYMSPVNLYIFGLVDDSLHKNKCKGFTYLESMGSKRGRNLALFILSYLCKKSFIMESTLPITTNFSNNTKTNVILPSYCKFQELNVIIDNCGG